MSTNVLVRWDLALRLWALSSVHFRRAFFRAISDGGAAPASFACRAAAVSCCSCSSCATIVCSSAFVAQSSNPCSATKACFQRRCYSLLPSRKCHGKANDSFHNTPNQGCQYHIPLRSLPGHHPLAPSVLQEPAAHHLRQYPFPLPF